MIRKFLYSENAIYSFERKNIRPSKINSHGLMVAWVGTRAGAGVTSILVRSFFGRRPWLHGHRRQHTSVLPLSPLFHRPRTFYLDRMLPPDAHGAIGCVQKNFIMLTVWRWHQLLFGSLPYVRLSRVSRRLGWELFTLPSYICMYIYIYICKTLI